MRLPTEERPPLMKDALPTQRLHDWELHARSASALALVQSHAASGYWPRSLLRWTDSQYPFEGKWAVGWVASKCL